MIKIEGCSPDLVEHTAACIGADFIEKTICYTVGNKIFYDLILSDHCYISFDNKFGLRIENFSQDKLMSILIDSRNFLRLVIE